MLYELKRDINNNRAKIKLPKAGQISRFDGWKTEDNFWECQFFLVTD
jgi:hypothetical protein